MQFANRQPCSVGKYKPRQKFHTTAWRVKLKDVRSNVESLAQGETQICPSGRVLRACARVVRRTPACIGTSGLVSIKFGLISALPNVPCEFVDADIHVNGTASVVNNEQLRSRCSGCLGRQESAKNRATTWPAQAPEIARPGNLSPRRREDRRGIVRICVI